MCQLQNAQACFDAMDGYKENEEYYEYAQNVGGRSSQGQFEMADSPP